MADSEEREQAESAASTPERQTSAELKAAKDRNCPFCGQAFTSSSLGRHLDLYIKPRNPKAPDGIHDADEIRKIRGGITRRQPKANLKSGANVNASGWKADSAGGTSTPPVHAKRASQSSGSTRSAPAPRVRGETDTTSTKASTVESPSRMSANANTRPGGRSDYRDHYNQPNWQSTGVINGLPPRESTQTSGTLPTGQTQRMHDMRHDAAGNRISRPQYVTDNDWKLVEDAEVGRAAELALRELLGSLEAAKKKMERRQLFDAFDFYSLSFPGLCLALLPSPPSIFSATPFPGACTWSFAPPGRKQFENVNRKISERVSEVRGGDASRFPDSEVFRHNTHVQGAFEHWQLLSEADRASAWTVEILRAFTSAKQDRENAVQERDAAQHRIRHLEAEFDRLARCQLPREYLLHPPNTIPISDAAMRELDDNALRSGAADVDYDAETLLRKWRDTVKSLRRRPPPGSYSHPRNKPADDPIGNVERNRTSENMLSGDLIVNGAVIGVNGPMPRDNEGGHSQTMNNQSDLNYETPPNPGVIVGAEAEDEEAGAESQQHQRQHPNQHLYQHLGDGNDTSNEGAIVRWDHRRSDESAPPQQMSEVLNAYGKRTYAQTTSPRESNGVTKMYKAHYTDR